MIKNNLKFKYIYFKMNDNKEKKKIKNVKKKIYKYPKKTKKRTYN